MTQDNLGWGQFILSLVGVLGLRELAPVIFSAGVPSPRSSLYSTISSDASVTLSTPAETTSIAGSFGATMVASRISVVVPMWRPMTLYSAPGGRRSNRMMRPEAPDAHPRRMFPSALRMQYSL